MTKRYMLVVALVAALATARAGRVPDPFPSLESVGDRKYTSVSQVVINKTNGVAAVQGEEGMGVAGGAQRLYLFPRTFTTPPCSPQPPATRRTPSPTPPPPPRAPSARN